MPIKTVRLELHLTGLSAPGSESAFLPQRWSCLMIAASTPDADRL